MRPRWLCGVRSLIQALGDDGDARAGCPHDEAQPDPPFRPADQDEAQRQDGLAGRHDGKGADMADAPGEDGSEEAAEQEARRIGRRHHADQGRRPAGNGECIGTMRCNALLASCRIIVPETIAASEVNEGTVSCCAVVSALVMVRYGGWVWRRNGRFARSYPTWQESPLVACRKRRIRVAAPA